MKLVQHDKYLMNTVDTDGVSYQRVFFQMYLFSK